ncbi:hypothetical protein F4819DRAFT_254036 [Hypoxylon fuscum]|nr:hypothetical protein F4819DRAFT_254036 [Hypoxylon fuscum]
MDSILFSIIVTVYLIFVGCHAGAYSYFAMLVSKELQPYFVEHGLERDSEEAQQVFIFLVVSAIILWMWFLHLLFTMCNRGGNDDSERSDSGCVSIILGFIQFGLAVTFLVFACLAAKYTWGWWSFFDVEGLDHLAATCHGLAGMIIAGLALTACSLVIAVITTASKLTH